MRELRSTHSNLLTELQQAFCEAANENMVLSKDRDAFQHDNTSMQHDVVALQDALQTLNSVRGSFLLPSILDCSEIKHDINI